MTGQETGRRIPVGEAAVRVDRLLFDDFRHHIFQISATLFDLDDRDSTQAGMFSTFSSIFFGSGIVSFVNEAVRMDVGTDPHMYEIDSPLAHGSFSLFSYTVGLRVPNGTTRLACSGFRRGLAARSDVSARTSVPITIGR